MTTTANVDPDEIRKFDELASRWWDPESEFKPLHAINPLRFGYINKRTPVEGLRIIDIGCGGGLLTEALGTAGADVTGVDMGEVPIAIAQEHASASGLDIRYVRSTAEDMASSEAGQYDIVTCLEMLEHVPDPAAVVAACQTLLKPGGSAYFSTINRTAKGYLFAVIGAEYVLNLLPKGTHDYARFIRPSELELFARQAGLSLQDIIGLHYNPLTQHYSLGPGVDVNYMMHCLGDRPE